MDARTQERIRNARANPHDPGALAQALSALRRAEQEIPADLEDRELLAPTTFTSDARLVVTRELADGSYEPVGTTPGTLEIGACRRWFVVPKPAGLDADMLEDLRRHAVPGLGLRNSRAVGEELALTADLPELRWLSLEEARKTVDPLLDSLPSHPRLSELHLTGCKITHAGLGNLARVPRLTRLHLDNCAKVQDLSALAHVPWLRRLSSYRACGAAKVLKTLPELPNLTHVNLVSAELPESGLAQLARLSGLRWLGVGVRGNMLSPKGLGAIGQLTPNLRALMIAHNHVEAPDLSALLPLQQLRYLNLKVGYVGSLEHLRDLPHLTHLRLTGCRHVDYDLLRSLPNLRHLSVWFSYQGDEGSAEVERFGELEQLETLGICVADRRRTTEELGNLARKLGENGLSRLWFSGGQGLGRAIRDQLPPSLTVTSGWHSERDTDSPGARGGTPWLDAIPLGPCD